MTSLLGSPACCMDLSVGEPAVHAGALLNIVVIGGVPLLEVVLAVGAVVHVLDLVNIVVGGLHIDLDGPHGAIGEDGAGVSLAGGDSAGVHVEAGDEDIVVLAGVQVNADGVAVLIQIDIVSLAGQTVVAVQLQRIVAVGCQTERDRCRCPSCHHRPC